MNHSSKLPSWLTLPGLCFRAIVLSLALAATTAVAQRAGDDPDDDDVLVLNPFIISESEDVGYIATNSTAGTSLNMLIRDIPLSLEVINREMIDDMQATTLEESLIYSAGVFTDTYQANNTATPGFVDNSPSTVGNYDDPFQNTISIRGYTVPNQQRGGFRVGFLHNVAGIVLGGSTDTITTERQEVVRGPQSLLYGINVMSGVTNIEPKRPLGDFFASTSVMVGNFNEFRATFDVSDAAIPGKLNYRVMGATHSFDDKDDIDFREHERQTLGVQFDWIITPRTTLFLEYIYAERESRGIGPQRFSTSQNLRDRYGEAFDFGQDDPTFPIWARGTGVVDDVYFQDHDLSFLGDGFPAADGVQDGPLVKNPQHTEYYDFRDRGRGFNISGPDTFKNQKESNIMAQLYHSFSDNFNMELGFYHSEVEIQERNLATYVIWNENDAALIRPTQDLGNPGRGTFRDWVLMPEVDRDALISDPIGYDLGEMFIFDRVVKLPAAVSHYIVEFAEPPTVDQAMNNPSYPSPNRVYGAYNWYSRPTTSESNQFRVRLAYDHETEFFGGETHTVVLGGSLIQDEINWISGTGSLQQYYSGGELQRPYKEKLATDPVIFRQSVFDMTPIRLQPDDYIPVAGSLSFLDLGGLTNTDPDGNTGPRVASSVARSGHHFDKLWFRGAYAIYRGRYWDDRVTLIAGVRHDSYQGYESEPLVAIDRNRETDRWIGSPTLSYIPDYYIGYGDKPWVYDPNLTDLMNERIASDIDVMRQNKPEGTKEYLFAESETFTTKSGGLTVKIIDPLSVYVAYAEGIFPNVGQRDAADNPIGPEQSESREIGIKFELFDRKISGTVSFWQIDRINAVTSWNYAPHPATYYGNPRQPVNPGSTSTFSPLNTYRDYTLQRPVGAEHLPSGNISRSNPEQASPYRGGDYWPLNYGIDIRYLERAMAELGIAPPDYSGGGGAGPDRADFAHINQEGGIIEIFDRNLNITTDASAPTIFIATIDYEKVLKGADPETNVFAKAFDLAMKNEQVFGPPVPGGDAFSGPLRDYEGAGIIYYSFSDPYLNNPSSKNFNVGVPVTYEEEGEGVDGQLIFAPTDNWQLVFNFSHQERSIVNLNLVDPIGLAPDGSFVNYGTEYDVWVYLLGRENFADPTRPSTYNGASVKGIDLSYVPQDSAGFITRYTFRQGLLEGLMIGGGARYESKVETASRIGGARLQENIYVPPNRPERWVFNAFARYGWEMWDIDWRIQFNIDNVFDHKEDIVVATYMGAYDIPVERRTRVYYQPRTWRVSLSAQF